MLVRVAEGLCLAPVRLEAEAQAEEMGAMEGMPGKETPYWSFC